MAAATGATGAAGMAVGCGRRGYRAFSDHPLAVPCRCQPAAIYRGVPSLLLSLAWLLQYASWIALDPNLDVQLRTSRCPALMVGFG
jgi:hypothetical protein